MKVDSATNLTLASVATCAKQDARDLRYVLITPAKNESAFIEQTIHSVVAQTNRPVRWIIVSDGSTDGMDEIVLRYVAEHPWIELLRMPERNERHFAGKVHAFNAGYSKVTSLEYEIIGSLDADLSFAPEYFEFLLGRFAENPKLGVAGTPFREEDFAYDYRFTSLDHVSGACQMFRRQCFEAVGGYMPIKVGGIDLVAVVTARMKGWETRTFTEFCLKHHRKMGTGQHRPLMIALKGGYHDYLMGVHPLWQIARSMYQLRYPPRLVGGYLLLVGYFWAASTGAERPVTQEFVKFRRMEQMLRLKRFFFEGIAICSWFSRRGACIC